MRTISTKGLHDRARSGLALTHEIPFPSPRSMPARLLRVVSGMIAVLLLLFPFWVANHLRHAAVLSDASKANTKLSEGIKSKPRHSPDGGGMQPAVYGQR
jgi:hypothetical protein